MNALGRFPLARGIIIVVLTGVLGALGACVGTGTEVCNDGRRCSDGYRCRAVTETEFECVLEACGNGETDPGEACDDEGESERCNDNCTLAMCGDGFLNASANEQCDDGNQIDGDGCQMNCRLPGCGDGVTDGDEQCDDMGESQDCNSDCTLSECGDGITNMTDNETCDDGNRLDGDGCQGNCRLPGCGDGILDPGEQCDDTGESMTCDADCTAARCGDGTLNMTAGEACDDGNLINSDGCQSTCVVQACGDGITDPDEQCDDAGESVFCDADCTPAQCGDDTLNTSAGEQCDDGNTTNADGCQGNCLIPVCGDGIDDPGEQCDEGGPTAACDDDCTAAICGDGTLNVFANEQCDDGNLIDGDGCQGNCQIPGCGDGILDMGEECDEGGPTPTCDIDCTSVACGDGVLNTPAGEECDDGNQVDGDTCQGNCLLPVCGDGIVDMNEDCDTSGESATCDDDCTMVLCGDNNLNTTAGEQCDDGDNADGDGCQGNCLLPVCGDGIVDMGEECDTAGESLACDDNCTAVVCGDGTVNMSAGEACDDMGESMACDSDCSPVVCGDGHTNTTAGEQCDDSGESATCDSDCTNVACGDSVENPTAGEQCDDGNTANGDGCTAICTRDIIVAAGRDHTCAILPGGSVRCWGDGLRGALGYGSTADVGDQATTIPSIVGDVDLGGTAKNIVAGDFHTCAHMSDDTVRCWGLNNQGQLGYGNTINIGDNETPATAGPVALGGPVAEIEAGGGHTCARLTSGAVHCWGINTYGQLGYGNTDNIGDDAGETPAMFGPVSLSGVAEQLSGGSEHTCARLASGAVNCWGRGAQGRLGYGNTNNIGDDELPSAAGTVSIGSTARSVSAGGFHTCAVLDDQSVKCWGQNSVGQLGYSNTQPIGNLLVPSDVNSVAIGGGLLAAEVIAGRLHTCVRTTTDRARCWGRGNVGQLGYGNTDNIGDNEFPSQAGDVMIGGVGVMIRLSAGGDHTCVSLDSNEIRCWGAGISGRLGYGNINNIGDNEVPASLASGVPYL